MNKSKFLASFPNTQSAIQIHGSGDGMRIQLDIPASEMAEAVKLQLWTQQVLEVTIKPVDNKKDEWSISR